MNTQDQAVIIHGGAGRISTENASKITPYLKQALEQAWNVLIQGASGEQAVVAALKLMEGCEYFNAGYGGYTDDKGIVALDLGLMKGNGDYIALTQVRRMKFPSMLALDLLVPGKRLMTVWTEDLVTLTPELEEKYGVVTTDEEMIAPTVREIIFRKIQPQVTSDVSKMSGTVGCVVRDAMGNITAGTSTGGIFPQPHGRIGDSPIIGGGVFADNEICGLSTSGHGESFISSHVSGFMIAEIRRALREDPEVFKKDPSKLKQILNTEFDELKRKTPGRGGMIIIPREGDPSYFFNSSQIAVGIKVGTVNQVRFEKVSVDSQDV